MNKKFVIKINYEENETSYIQSTQIIQKSFVNQISCWDFEVYKPKNRTELTNKLIADCYFHWRAIHSNPGIKTHEITKV